MPGIARRRHVFEGRALIGLVLGAVVGLGPRRLYQRRQRDRQRRAQGGAGPGLGEGEGSHRGEGRAHERLGRVLRGQRDVHHGVGPVRRRAAPDRAHCRGRDDCGGRPGLASRGRRGSSRGGRLRAASRRRCQGGAGGCRGGTGRGPEPQCVDHELPQGNDEPQAAGAGCDGQPRQGGRDAACHRPAGHHRRDAARAGLRAVQRGRGRPGDVVAAAVRRRRLPDRRATGPGGGGGPRLHEGAAEVPQGGGLLHE